VTNFGYSLKERCSDDISYGSDHRKTYFLGRLPRRKLRGMGGNGSIQRLCRPQTTRRHTVEGLGMCRHCARKPRLICHGCHLRPVPPRATSVGGSAMVSLLIAAVGHLPLPTPGSRTARWAAVALTAVTTDADGEYLSGVRVAAQFQPESRTAVWVGIRHLELCHR